MTKLYALLNEDGSIGTFFGGSPQDKNTYPDLVEIKSSDKIYHDYYSLMFSMGIADGMVDPD